MKLSGEEGGEPRVSRGLKGKGEECKGREGRRKVKRQITWKDDERKEK